MAGLSLSMGAYGGATQGAMPHAAGVSPGAPTITQQAFGTWSQNSAAGSPVAAAGVVTLGLIGVGVLLWLWYSLPR